MPFALKRKVSVDANVRQLIHERIERALRFLDEAGQTSTGIHEVRKDLKRLRAVLNLVRAEVGKSNYSSGKRALRQAARLLSVRRDAWVLQQTLEHLITSAPPAAKSIASVRPVLKNSRHRASVRSASLDATHRAARILRAQDHEFASLHLRHGGWRAVGTGVERSYRRSRRAYSQALKDGSAERFHAWRKRLKDLYYQVDLLVPACPKRLRRTEKDLERLGELLGEDHDLYLLQQTVAAKRLSSSGKQALPVLIHLIGDRQQRLRTEALAIAKKLYAEKPGRFSKRLGRYWKQWRDARRN